MRYLKSVIFEYIANHYDYLAKKNQNIQVFLYGRLLTGKFLKNWSI